jgi:hypothetical protein
MLKSALKTILVMRKLLVIIMASFCALIAVGCNGKKVLSAPDSDTVLISDTIQYHPVRINKSDGSILPWYSSNIGVSYDTVLLLVWNFWNNMETDSNGLKYYLNHQVWSPGHDMRGLGGDQINMALSSWTLLYAYTGYQAIIENMKYLADNYLERSLSDSTDAWPFLPYPYNTDVHSGKYDGDMRNGKGITQPDKAGNFGYELVNLYKMTGVDKYLKAAERIATTLMMHIIPGDSTKSPLPFRVNAKTGESGFLFNNSLSGRKAESALYTSNWTGTMMLFKELEAFNPVKSDKYEKAFETILSWMKTYPLKTNKWGPFFEDIPGWSDTQTNAITFTMYILRNPGLFPDWQKDIKGIIEWTHKELGNRDYSKYNVEVMNEQTVYRVPGNSHSSRQASVELIYTDLSGDTTYKTNAIRTLNWATYTVASDGRNRYIHDDIWLTDGYGDYIRHFLRAMYAFPELAPSDKNRFLGTSSVVTSINYRPDSIMYFTYDRATDILRLKQKPLRITCEGKELMESLDKNSEGFSWKDMGAGGVLKIKHEGKKIIIFLK